MARYAHSICLMFFAAVLFTACVEDDETEVILYDDIAITDFEITSGTVSGTEDVSLSAYPFSIDHLNGLIFNTDSLPMGTDPSTLVCTYSTKNNGLVYIEDLMGDGWSQLTTSNAVNFGPDRNLMVMSSGNGGERRYTVSVRIHQEAGDEFRWARLPDNQKLAAGQGVKAVVCDDRLLVFCREGSSTVMMFADVAGNGGLTDAAETFGADAYANVAVFDGQVYVLDGQTLKVSADGGMTFAEKTYTYTDADGNAGTIARLVGAGTKEMYAISSDRRIAVSRDGGATWAPDNGTAADSEWLPDEDVAFCCAPFAHADSTDYVLMAGNCNTDKFAGDTTAVVWRKIAEYASDSKSGQWVYIDLDPKAPFALPRMANIAVAGYDGRIIAIGGAGKGGCTLAPYTQMYDSRDGGITWKRNADYALPDDFDSTATDVAAVTDGDNNLWLVCAGTGQVWRGRMNRLGWAIR